MRKSFTKPEKKGAYLLAADMNRMEKSAFVYIVIPFAIGKNKF